MTPHPTRRRRPNILFLQTDHQRHDALGCVNPLVKTPNLDALAARGVRFSEAVCNVPMCVPSRYSMMTGLYGSQLGVRHNRQIITRDEDLPVPVLAQRLAEAGYQTAGFGKTHWYLGLGHNVPGQVGGTTRGFEVRALARPYLDRMNEGDPTRVAYMAEEAPQAFRARQAERANGGPGGETVSGYVGASSAIPAEQHAEAWLTRKALDFLERGRDPDRPWFCYLSFDAPHPGLYVPAVFERLYDLAEIDDVPPVEPLPGGHREGWREDVWDRMNERQRRLARLRFWALCSFADHLFGQVLQRLAAIGEADNTLVIMTADHGDMLGDRGRITKYCLYEGSVRVPLIVAGPGATRPQVDGRSAELVDVMPTLLDAAELEVPPELPGSSLLRPPARRGAFAEMHGQGYENVQQAPAYMWRTGEWKLILHLPGELHDAAARTDDVRGELYHLTEDPCEVRNLYEDPAHLPVRERLTRALLMRLACAHAAYPQRATPVALRPA
jgi:arylsulfatase A-like enzyme